MERAKAWDKLKKYRPEHLLGSFALSCLLAAGQWGGLYAPWCVGFGAARGASPRGFAALLGALLGGYLFFPFQAALRHGATVLLLYAAALSFVGSRWEKRAWFAPLAACASLWLVHSVYLVGRGLTEVALWLVAGVSAWLVCRRMQGVTLTEQTEVEALGVCLALVNVMVGGFSPGRLGAVWLALWLSDRRSRDTAPAIGGCIGLTMDLAAARPAVFLGAVLPLACYGAMTCRSRTTRALAYCLAIGSAALVYDYDMAAPLLFETFTAAAAYLLTPHRSRRTAPLLSDSTCSPRASAFRALYDALFGEEGRAAEENPAVIFDRAAEKVCRTCPQAARCYHRDYQSTHDAFTHAAGKLLQRGGAAKSDFPDWFSDGCERFGQFLSAVNDESYAYLLRGRYRRRLQELRRLAALPYAQMGQAMEETAPVSTAAPTATLEVCHRTRSRTAGALCGDETDSFTVGDITYLLLSDGMGSGKDAHAEAAMTVRLLRQFLEAGITAEAALRTLNTALRLREGDGFTTIDLALFHRHSGRVEVYKYGACDSFCCRTGGQVEPLSCSTLPAGLETRSDPPPLKCQLRHGDILLLVSDGVLSAGEAPLRQLLAGWEGSMEALARAILDLCRGSDDDCAVIAARCAKPGLKRV